MMHCYTVCVDYWDFLAITLPKMAKWFGDVTIITAPDQPEHTVLPNIRRYSTDAFYRDGAVFNKGRAIEECWQDNPPTGWVCVIDADILLPDIPSTDAFPDLEVGNLYSPRRRQYFLLADSNSPMWGRTQTGPKPDRLWDNFTLVDDSITRCPGFMQVFHTADPVLRTRPWYPTHWKHAGGCDSDFCEKWPKARQKRLDFDVLHLGESRKNWCGRVTPLPDGSVLSTAADREQAMRFMFAQRRNGSLRHEQIRKVC